MLERLRATGLCIVRAIIFSDVQEGMQGDVRLPLMRAQAGETVISNTGGHVLVQMPAQGIEPLWVARLLVDLRLRQSAGVSALRVEAPNRWRWGSAEAAFLGRTLHVLRRAASGLPLTGVPAARKDLLALTWVRGGRPAAPSPVFAFGTAR